MDDIDHIMAIMADAFDPYWGEGWTRRQISDSLVMPGTFYRLIGADGSSPLAGPNPGSAQECPSAGFTLSRHIAGEEELLLIAVRPAYRGKGLGRKLIKYLEQDAGARTTKRLFLEMRSNNPAEMLYRSCGFQPIGRRKDYYRMEDGSHLDAITFAIELI